MENLVKQAILNSIKEDSFGFDLKLSYKEYMTFYTIEEADEYLSDMTLTYREEAELYFINTGNFIEDLSKL